jgi:predicted hydrocarbon binding protein
MIFNLLEQFITENFGGEKYEEILAASDLRTQDPFVWPGTYPDEDLSALVIKTAEATGTSVPRGLYAFGKFCFSKLADRYPMFVEPHDHPKEFLKTIGDIHNVELRKLCSDAAPPQFTFEDPSASHLIIRYSSRRKLCRLTEGLIDGVADYYESPIKHEQKACMLEGHNFCEFHLVF